MKKILLIDDDPTLGHIIKNILKDEGFDTIIQADSQHINETIEKNPPDLIILDYFLPTETGDKVAERLKAQKQTQHLPIIMVSSSYGIEAIAQKVGVEAFLPKPFDFDTLLGLIHRFIG